MGIESSHGGDQTGRQRSLHLEGALAQALHARRSGRPDIAADYGTLLALAEEAQARTSDAEPYQLSDLDAAAIQRAAGTNVGELGAAAKGDVMAHLAAVAGRSDIAATPLQAPEQPQLPVIPELQ